MIWLLWFSSFLINANTSLPQAPLAPASTHIFDESNLLTPNELNFLQQLLTEHERATLEPIVFWISKNSILNEESASLDQLAQEKYHSLGIGTRGRGQGFFYIIQLNPYKTALFVGPAQTDLEDPEPLDAALKEVKSFFKKDEIYFALFTLIKKTLKERSSPILELDLDQRALEIESQRISKKSKSQNFFLGALIKGSFIILGLFLLLLLVRIRYPDAHFSASGWVRENPVRAIKREVKSIFLRAHDPSIEVMGHGEY